METSGVGRRETGDAGTEMGDAQVGGGPCAEAVDYGTYTGETQVLLLPLMVSLEV